MENCDFLSYNSCLSGPWILPIKSLTWLYETNQHGSSHHTSPLWRFCYDQLNKQYHATNPYHPQNLVGSSYGWQPLCLSSFGQMVTKRFSNVQLEGSNITANRGNLLSMLAHQYWSNLFENNAANGSIVSESREQMSWNYNSFRALSPAMERAAWNWRAYCLCNSLSLCNNSWNVGLHVGSLVLTKL